ncbi:MAG: cation:proton antiporter [Alphaproteobacteria bacterium]|nr:cation:proton antiporter [Alphaproteobacteria bacterium]
MEHFGHLNDVLIFLLSAVVVVSTFRWLRISPVIGYLIAGILIGPYALKFISNVEETKIIGEFGVVFLLFSIGLKLPLKRLQFLKRYVFGLGISQVVLTACAIGCVAYMCFGQNLEAAFLIGSVLALSSTAVCLQILTEKGELAARFGRVSFSVLLFQDLVVVILLVLITTCGVEESNIWHELGHAALKAGLVLVFIIAAARIILRPVYKAIATLGNPELFVAMSLLVVLTTSVITASAGLSLELGAFLAGLLLSETEYRHQVEADIEPFHGLLLGLFFMTVGMSIDLSYVSSHFLMVTSMVIGLLVCKILIVMFLCIIFTLPLTTSLRTALLLASGGEFVFVLMGPAIQNQLVSPEVGQILFTVVIISMGLTPLLDMLGKYIEDHTTAQEAKTTTESAMAEIGDLRKHVIIAGFGRVGQMVARMLTERMVPYVAIDNDMARVHEGRTNGLPVFYGDARSLNVMRAIGAERAKVVVVALNKPLITLKTSLMVKRNFKEVHVCARLLDEEHKHKFVKAGVNVIMPENLEPSLQLAASVLQALGTSEDEVGQVIQGFRRTLTASFQMSQNPLEVGADD